MWLEMTQQLENKSLKTWRTFDKEFNWDNKEKLKEFESLHPDEMREYILKTVDNVVERSYSNDPNKQ